MIPLLSCRYKTPLELIAKSLSAINESNCSLFKSTTPSVSTENLSISPFTKLLLFQLVIRPTFVSGEILRDIIIEGYRDCKSKENTQSHFEGLGTLTYAPINLSASSRSFIICRASGFLSVTIKPLRCRYLTILPSRKRDENP